VAAPGSSIAAWLRWSIFRASKVCLYRSVDGQYEQRRWKLVDADLAIRLLSFTSFILDLHSSDEYKGACNLAESSPSTCHWRI
jgi:hypothetical protein